MNPPNRILFNRRNRSSGAALIITLAFLVLVAIMVVGMMESVRVERSASRTHYERMRATVFAQQGVDRALASLRQATSDKPQEANETNEKYQERTRNWASQPGQLLIPDPLLVNSTKSIDRKRIAAVVPLSSGVPTPELLDLEGPHPEFMRPPDLNLPTLLDPTQHLITEEEVLDDGTGSPSGGTVNQRAIAMNVRWIYVRKDGTYAKENGQLTDLPDLADKQNPIVGRFAYWTDDESTKVNYNLAWTRNPTSNNEFPEGHQTRVGLDALLDGSVSTGGTPGYTLANRLHEFVTPKGNFENIGRFFNSPFEARQVALSNGSPDPILAEALKVNKFNLTHYNADPDTTFYGLPRLMLTTQAANAVRRDNQGNVIMKNGQPVFRPFLDIMKRSPGDLSYKDPGFLNNIDAGASGTPGGKLHQVVQNLVDNYLKKTDWPMVGGTGSSLQDKYYNRYNSTQRNQRLAQLALNIIEYVRSAESEKPVVEPIRGQYKGGIFVTDFIDTSIRGQTDSFKGVVRGPLITEMGMWVSPTPEPAGHKNAGKYKSFGFVEVYLPQNYGLDRVDLIGLANPALGIDTEKSWKLYFREMGNGKYVDRSGNPLQTEYNITWRLTENPASAFSPVFVWDTTVEGAAAAGRAANFARNTNVAMTPGEYRTIAFEGWRSTKPGPGQMADLRAAITMNHPNGYRIDVAPLSDQSDQIKVNLEDGLADYKLIQTVETVDPRVNGVKKDWQPNIPQAGRRNTMFGPGNERISSRWRTSEGFAPLTLKTGEPQQDVDRFGNVSTASFRMPYPKGHKRTVNGAAYTEPGLVKSSGELGLIHTGVEGNSTVPSPDQANLLGGVPWRSLRLQPSKDPVTTVPDWAFMDLFTVPADVPKAASWLFNPHTTATGGRVNMNAHPEPFTMNRIMPLAAVLLNARKNTINENERVSFSEAKQIASNIYKRVLAKGSNGLPNGKAYGATGKFAHYESPGEVVEIEGIANKGEESEELVRGIANLISSRSNVFTVYTVGQALRQTPDGKLLVTAEQRQQAMLERYVESDLVTGADAIDYTKFRTVYFRNLIP